MRRLLPIVFALVLVGCRGNGDAPLPVEAPGTPGVAQPLPAGAGTHIFAKPVDKMDREEVKQERSEIAALETKLDQRDEQLADHDRQLVEGQWALWLRLAAAGLFALAVILMILTVKFGWLSMTTAVKIALGLAVGSSVCLVASFLVHYFLAIAIALLVGFGGYVVVLLWHNNWSTRKALEEAEDGVRVLAKSAGNKLDATVALSEAKIHNTESLSELLRRVGAGR